MRQETRSPLSKWSSFLGLTTLYAKGGGDPLVFPNVSSHSIANAPPNSFRYDWLGCHNTPPSKGRPFAKLSFKEGGVVKVFSFEGLVE